MRHNAAIRRSVVLKHRPRGEPGTTTSKSWKTDPGARPRRGRGPHDWLSIDPYMRGRLREEQTYAVAIQIGEVMTGETVGEVIASAHPGFVAGDIAVGARGWQSHNLANGRATGEDRTPWCAVIGLSRRAGHAGRHGLCRGYRDPEAESWRDVRCIRRLRCGGIRRWSARQTCRRARGGDRRRAGQVPVGTGQSRFRRLCRPPLARSASGAEGRMSGRHRRLFRKRRRRGAGGGVRAAQSVRPRGDVRHGLPIQRARVPAGS